MTDFGKTPFGPNEFDTSWKEFQHYQLDKDKKTINFVHVSKTVGEGPSLSNQTIRELDEIVDAIGKKEVGLKEGEAGEIGQFIESYQEKIKDTIRDRHKVFGGVIIWFQENLGTGELGKLSQLKNQFANLSKLFESSTLTEESAAQKLVQPVSNKPTPEPKSVELSAAEKELMTQKVVQSVFIESISVPKSPQPSVSLKKTVMQELPQAVPVKSTPTPPNPAPRRAKEEILKKSPIAPEESLPLPLKEVKVRKEPPLAAAAEPAPLPALLVEKQDLNVHKALIAALTETKKAPAARSKKAAPPQTQKSITSMQELEVAIKATLKDDPKLTQFLKKVTLSSESALLIAKQMELPGVTARFVQLEKALVPTQFEKQALSANEILQQAIFIQTLPKVDNTAQKVFETKEAPRAVHVDREKKIIAVIPKESTAVIKAQGAAKKVISAVAVHLNPSKEFNLPIVQMTAIKGAEKKELASIEHEIAIYKELAGTTGIAEIISVADETKAVKRAELPTKSILAVRAPHGDIQRVIQERKSIDVRTQIQWAHRLFTTFAAIHEKGYIHGDIKGDNILLDPNKQPIVTDFGMAFATSGKIVPHELYVRDSCYGTMEYSSPDLFCRPADSKFVDTATAIDYQKTESFALGMVLYSIRKGEDLPWMEDFTNAYTKEPGDKIEDHRSYWASKGKGVDKSVTALLQKKTVSPALYDKTIKDYWDGKTKELQAAVTNGVRECIEKPFKQLQSVQNKTEDDHYNWVIYNVMRENPSERWTMQQAFQYMEKYLIAA